MFIFIQIKPLVNTRKIKTKISIIINLLDSSF